jgi:hypothetical protein
MEAFRTSWNPNVKSVTLQGPVQQGTVFRWKSGPSTLTSTLQVLDPPNEIAWTGTTMASRPCTYSGSRPTTAARWRVPRSPGRACWPGCSRATAARPWTRRSVAFCRISRPRPSGGPRRREWAARRHLDGPVPVQLAMLAALAHWGSTVGGPSSAALSRRRRTAPAGEPRHGRRAAWRAS